MGVVDGFGPARGGNCIVRSLYDDDDYDGDTSDGDDDYAYGDDDYDGDTSDADDEEAELWIDIV